MHRYERQAFGTAESFAEKAILRARERRSEKEFFERERTSWQGRVRALEGECCELEEAINMGSAEGRLRDKKSAEVFAAVATEWEAAVTSARAASSMACLRARSMENEEALLATVMCEREESSQFHYNTAQAMQFRADELEVSGLREAEIGEPLVAEFNALEARAVMEERRCVHEQRVRALHLQVTEATTKETEVSEENSINAVHLEEEEDAARHVAAMRQIRTGSARRLVTLEEEEAARWCDRQSARQAPRRRRSEGPREVAGGAAPPVDARSADILSQLRARRAAESARIVAVRRDIAEELLFINEEAGEQSEEHCTAERQLIAAQSEARALCDATDATRTATVSLACRCTCAERQLREFAGEEIFQLAAAEMRAAREHRWQSGLSELTRSMQVYGAELKRSLEHVEMDATTHLAKRAQKLEMTIKATAAANRRRECRIVESDMVELAAAEEACAADAAEADMQRGEMLHEAHLNRDRARHMLAQLREALRQQFDAAEAAHEAAIGDEVQAERALLEAQLDSTD